MQKRGSVDKRDLIKDSLRQEKRPFKVYDSNLYNKFRTFSPFESGRDMMSESRYSICRVKVTRRSVLQLKRSDPPCNCMIRRERLSPIPDPSGLVV